MPLHDLGYRPWEGEVNSPWMRWWVIAETGVRLAWRSRWLRRILVLSWMPVIVAGGFFFAVEYALNHATDLRQMMMMFTGGIEFMTGRAPEMQSLVEQISSSDPHSARAKSWAILLLTFFRVPQGMLTVMLVALIAPPLIAQDIRSKAFLLYFSRPITRLEYIGGKMAVVGAYLALVTVVPGFVLYGLGVGLSPDLGVIQDTWDLPMRVVAASLVVAIPTVTFSLALSALLGESRFATFCWFAPWALGWFAYSFLTAMSEAARYGRTAGFISADRDWAFISPYNALGQVESWVFGLQTDFSEVAPEALMLSVVTLVSMGVLLRKVSAPMRI